MNRILYLLFSFEGRIGRLTYFLAGLMQLVVMMLLMAYPVIHIINLPKGQSPSAAIVLWMLPLVVLGTWMGLALIAKRYHDRGKSVLWYLVTFIPVIGPIWVFVELQFLPGESGSNRFGPPPGGGRIDFDAVRDEVRAYAQAVSPATPAPVHDIRSHMKPQPVVVRMTRTPIGTRPVNGFGKRGLR